MNRIVYKIDDENINILKNLKVDECCPVEDNNGNKIIINKLLLGENKLFLETKYLKVININYNDKKIYLELPKSHVNFFSELDEISSTLLADLINGNTNLDINEMFECLDIYFNNLENIQYKSILEENTNILKINIFPNTTIKNKNNNNVLSINDINPGDFIGVVLGLDYISLLVDNDSLLARTKLYCYFIQIHKQHIYKPEPRETINDWNFSSKLTSENIFLKTNITKIDNIDVKTETEPITKFNDSYHRNTTNNFHNILEHVLEEDEKNDLSSLYLKTNSEKSSKSCIKSRQNLDSNINIKKNNDFIEENNDFIEENNDFIEKNNDFIEENNSISSNSISSNLMSSNSISSSLILDIYDNINHNENTELSQNSKNKNNNYNENNNNYNENNNFDDKEKQKKTTNKITKTKTNKTNIKNKTTKNEKILNKEINLNTNNEDNNIEKKSRTKKKILIDTNVNNIINNQNNKEKNNQFDNSKNKNDKIIKIVQEDNKTKSKRGRKKLN
jgi:hypothetical protein